jgi:hypothetical protein
LHPVVLRLARLSCHTALYPCHLCSVEGRQPRVAARKHLNTAADDIALLKLPALIIRTRVHAENVISVPPNVRCPNRTPYIRSLIQESHVDLDAG